MSHREAFRAAIEAAGMVPPEHIQDDGQLHRFSSNGKRGDLAGWYVLHGDKLPAGSFGCWRQDFSQTWRANSPHALTVPESEALQARIRQQRELAEAERRRLQVEAAKKAEDIWRQSTPAPADHPYLTAKGIKPHNARSHGERLVLAIRDVDGTMRSLQYIAADGEKRFLAGGRVDGCYFGIGRPNGVLCVAEGFATAATIHEATGYAVAVAFNAGNLLAVAKALRQKHPGLRIIVCADNDRTTQGNPGLTKGREACAAIGGELAFPNFPEGASGSDFNDLATLAGLDAVAALVNGAAPDPGSPKVTLVRASDLRPEPIRWAWDGYLACGKLHILAGPPGTGKTTVALALASVITLGGLWPDRSRCDQPGNVLVWSGEDDARDTLLPRLLAMGADVNRVLFVGDVSADGQQRPFDPARDLEPLANAARAIGGARLLIVDPIVNAVSGDTHKNGEVRRALQPLVELGARLDAAVLGISHFSKGTPGRDPVERVTGSIAFGALARMVFAAVKRQEEAGGGRIIVRAKSNISPDTGGFRYDLEQAAVPGHPGLFASRVLWGETVEGDARALLAQAEVTDNPEEQEVRREAVDWLHDVLSGGPMKAGDVQREARQAGISEKALRTARERLAGC
jgi:putative DNA primase/helicase